jgi:hypothetical protein
MVAAVQVHEAIREDPTAASKNEYEPDKQYKKKGKDSRVRQTRPPHMSSTRCCRQESGH